MIYLFEVSVRQIEQSDLQPIYLFYKAQETPLELRKSIDSMLAKVREEKKSPIHDRIFLANELNVFFDRIKILMLGIPFEPQKLEGTGIQVLVFKIPHLIEDHEVNILAIADSEDSPIAVKRVIKSILTRNKDKFQELIRLAIGKKPEEIPDNVLDIYNELDFKASEVLRSKIRKIRWAEKAKSSAALLGLIIGLASLFLLTILVLWFDWIYHFLNRDTAIVSGLLIILATGFVTGFFTGWSKWIKVSAPLVSIIGTTTLMVTLLIDYISAGSEQLGLSTWTFSLLLATIMFAMILFMYFIAFISGYYLVETRALTPPKIRIVVEKTERMTFWKKISAKIRRLS